MPTVSSFVYRIPSRGHDFPVKRKPTRSSVRGERRYSSTGNDAANQLMRSAGLRRPEVAKCRIRQ